MPPLEPSSDSPLVLTAESKAITLPDEWRTKKVSIVLPTYNEIDNLPIILEAILSLPLPNLKIFVVDDNSPDGTGELADKLAGEYNAAGQERVAVVHRPGKEGLGRAYVDGMSRALEDGAEYVVQMDSDMSHDPKHVPEMLGTLLSTGAGVVIGSRYTVSGSLDASWGPHRKLLSAWANFYVHLILGLHVRDVTAGYKLWRREDLLRMDLPTVQSSGYSFQVEMNYRALLQGCKILEVPIHFTERQHGKSKMALSTQLESALVPIRLRMRSRVTRKVVLAGQ